MFGRHNVFFIITTVSCFFPHRVAPCPLGAEVSPSWRKRQIRSPSAHPGSPHCPSHWDCCRKTCIQKSFFFFLLLKVPTDYIATGRLLSKILQQAFALTVQPCFFLFISKLQILPSWEKSVCFITHWKTFSHLFAETALVDGSHNESELSFNLNCTYRTTLLISCDSALARTHWVLIWAADSLFILRIFIPFWWACDLRSLYT